MTSEKCTTWREPQRKKFVTTFKTATITFRQIRSMWKKKRIVDCAPEDSSPSWNCPKFAEAGPLHAFPDREVKDWLATAAVPDHHALDRFSCLPHFVCSQFTCSIYALDHHTDASEANSMLTPKCLSSRSTSTLSKKVAWSGGYARDVLQIHLGHLGLNPGEQVL